ncbi:hypothetical protein [Streptomyces sp. NPDC052811]|uniref:hypothetical protein n=1 Tax=Streptomyces sp. NPDC052811 TaxID=3155731 RepID=UPI00341A0AB4
MKDTDGKERPMWRTRWSAPGPQWGDATHPPVLLVFHQVGKRSALQQMKNVAELIREHWQGQWAEGGFRIYNQRMPIVATTLELLREYGPAGPAFWRFGREDRQNLWEAIGNPRRDAALARRAEERRRRQAQEAAGREAQRPVCTDCGQKFTDDRWKASIAVDWGRRDSHPHVCHDCKAKQSKRSDRRNRPNASARSRRRRRTRRPAAGSDAGAADPGTLPRQRESLPRTTWASPRCRRRLRGWRAAERGLAYGSEPPSGMTPSVRTLARSHPGGETAYGHEEVTVISRGSECA